MGKTFKDQRQFDRKRYRKRQRELNLPRVRVKMNTGTRVHTDKRESADVDRNNLQFWQDEEQ